MPFPGGVVRQKGGWLMYIANVECTDSAKDLKELKELGLIGIDITELYHNKCKSENRSYCGGIMNLIIGDYDNLKKWLIDYYYGDEDGFSESDIIEI